MTKRENAMHHPEKILAFLVACSLCFACTDSETETEPPNQQNEALDQTCYDQCVDKGETEAVCRAFCEDGDKDDDKPATQNGEAYQLTVGDMTRRYRIHVPEMTPTNGRPILFAFHGGGGRNGTFPQEAQFIEASEQAGFIFVYPMGEVVGDNEGEWQLNTRNDARHDIAFVEQLIDTISNEHTVDRKRIYATGYSLGSMFTYEVACQLSTRFAAVASHAGTMPISPSDCAAPSALGVLHIHGVQDEIIPYAETWDWKQWDEVGTMHSVDGLLGFWREKLSCAAPAEMPGNNATHRTYANCANGARLEHYQVTNGGHEWPNSINGEATHQVIWRFLNGFSKD